MCFTDSLSTTNRYVLMLKKKNKKKKDEAKYSKKIRNCVVSFFSACAIDIELKYESIQGKVFMFRIFFMMCR